MPDGSGKTWVSAMAKAWERESLAIMGEREHEREGESERFEREKRMVWKNHRGMREKKGWE